MLPKQYECGPVPLPHDPDAAFARHLVFDHMIEPEIGVRMRTHCARIATSRRARLMKILRSSGLTSSCFASLMKR